MLRVVAITAPHWVKSQDSYSSRSLNSQEPFSLHNAIRLAAYTAQEGRGVWGRSNWNNLEGREQSIFLYEYYENHKEKFIKIIKQVRPNLLFIGSMSIGFAGAIAVANIAKEILRESVFIVIGGKHIIETTYLTNGRISENSNCSLSLMKNKRIPKVFDLVLSGDGEEVIVEIGKLIGECETQGKLEFYAKSENLKKASGDWLAGWLDENNDYQFVESTSKNLDQNSLPNTIKVFGVKSQFPIFQSDITAHTYSYMSKGCVYDCFFCSEKNSINGKLLDKESAPQRLLDQFHSLREYGEKNNFKKISAFIEDSILLGGNVKLLKRLNELLISNNINLSFGGQMTGDLLLNIKIQNIIKDLTKNGLTYLFIGLETNITDIADQMSKNTTKKTDWIIKYEAILQFLKDANIKCGFSILFGLGENHSDRIRLLSQIDQWQDYFGNPHVISLNYATQHPLKNSMICQYDYTEWGTSSESPLLPIFTELFGEASEKYILPNTKLGIIDEFLEIKKLFLRLNLKYQ